MYQDLPIQDIYAREILDSRGNPTGRSGDTCRGADCRAFRSAVRSVDRKI